MNNVPGVDINLIYEIISTHALFAQLSSEARHYLASLFTFHSYTSDEMIVEENAIVDSIYFIVNGRAEVRKTINTNGINEVQPVATLSTNECIGLKESDIYSPLGGRCATVAAITPLTAIRLDIMQFKDFMDEYPIPSEKLVESLQIIARMNFIKRLLPFSELPLATLYRISKKIKEMRVSANTILFNQGDIGDACYLLESGHADVLIKLPSGEEKKIAEVTPPNIIGEASLLSGMPRNATIKITSNAKLLLIDKPLFIELTQSESTFANAFKQLQKSRFRPVQVPGIEHFEKTTSEGVTLITLKNPGLGKYYQMSLHGWFIWQQLNGENSLMDITYSYYEEFQIFNPELISKFIVDLSLSGFVQFDQSMIKLVSENKLPFFVRVFSGIAGMLEYKYSFKSPNAWLTSSYQKFVWIFYSKIAQILWLGITLAGLIIFISLFSQAALALSRSPNKWELFIFACIAAAFTIPLHELSHAYMTKYYGRHVHGLGVGWYWIAPFAFCDTSDMWISPRSQRIMVDLVGVYTNLIIAGLGSIIMFIFHDYQNVFIFFSIFALLNYLFVVSNLYPGIELDGYYALMDIFDKPNLRLSAMEWATNKKNNNKNHKESYKAEISYWILSILYIIFIQAFVSYLVIHYLLYGLFQYKNVYLTVMLVIIAMLLSSIKLYCDILENKKLMNSLK